MLRVLEPYENLSIVVAEYADEFCKTPEELLQEFDDFLSFVGHSMYDNSLLPYARFETFPQLARIFLSTQSWKDNRNLNGYTITPLAEFMTYNKEAPALYDSLTPDSQSFLLSEYRSNTMWPVDLYLRTLSKLGSHPTNLIRNHNFKKYRVEHKYIDKNRVDRALEEIRENASIPSVIESLDLTPTSIEFIEAIIPSSAVGLTSTPTHAVELFTLWKALYSEQVLMRVIQDFSKHSNRLCPNDLMNIMDNWEYWSNFPTDWIIEVYKTEKERVS